MVTGRVTNISAWKDFGDYQRVGVQINDGTWYNVYGSVEECNAKTAGFTVGDTVEFGVKEGTRKVEGEIKLVTGTVSDYTPASELPAESRVERLARCIRDAEKAWKLSEFVEVTGDMVSRSAHMFFISESKR